MLSSSPSSPVSPSSTTVDAASVASAHSSSHRLRPCLLAIVQPLLPSASTSFPPPPTSPASLSLSTVLAIHRRDPPSLPPSPFPPSSTIDLLSPSSLSVAVIPTPSPSSPASTDADLPLLSLFSLLHLVGSLLLLPVTDLMSTSPSAVSLLPLQPSPLLAPPPPSPSSSISLSPPSPLHVLPFLRLRRRTPPRAAAASVAAVAPAPSSPHRRLFDPTSPASRSLHRHSPPPPPPPSSSPLCCRAPPPLPCFSTPATITLFSGSSTVCKLPLPPFASPSPNIVDRLL